MPEAAQAIESVPAEQPKVDSTIPSEDAWSASPEERGDFFDPTEEVPTSIDQDRAPNDLPPMVVEEEVEELEGQQGQQEQEEQVAQPEPEPAEMNQTEDKQSQSHMIPKARLDTQIAKTRDLEHENIRIQEQLRIMQEQMNQIQNPVQAEPEVPKFDYAAKSEQMNEAILEGEKDQAATILQEILQEQRKDIESNIMQNVEQTIGMNSREIQMKQELESTTKQLEQDYPQFNPENADIYDQEVVDNVNRLMTAYTYMKDNQGYAMYTPASALQEAVKTLVGVPQTAEAESKAQPQPKANLKKKIQASNQQPPELRGDSGADHGTEKTMDVFAMPEDEFDALPASTIRKLRGDA